MCSSPDKPAAGVDVFEAKLGEMEIELIEGCTQETSHCTHQDKHKEVREAPEETLVIPTQTLEGDRCQGSGVRGGD